jgi:hypothetical protein
LPQRQIWQRLVIVFSSWRVIWPKDRLKTNMIKRCSRGQIPPNG